MDVAWWQGHVVQAHVAFPYMRTRAGGVRNSFAGVTTAGSTILLWLGGFFVLLLAVRNWRLDRADHQGAWRIAAACFVLRFVAWAGNVHAASLTDLLDFGRTAIAQGLLLAAVLWLVYLALEPAVRARWPHSIMTWNRVLAGRWLDAQVGSHILIGAAAGGPLRFSRRFSAEPSSWDVWLMPPGHPPVDRPRPRTWWRFEPRHVRISAIFGLRRLLRNDLLAAVANLFTHYQEVSSAERVAADRRGLLVYACLIFRLRRAGLYHCRRIFANGVNMIVMGAIEGLVYGVSLATLPFLSASRFGFWRRGRADPIRRRAGLNPLTIVPARRTRRYVW